MKSTLRQEKEADLISSEAVARGPGASELVDLVGPRRLKISSEQSEDFIVRSMISLTV